MLQVYTVYLCMVNQPQLNLTRAAVALSLVAMALWQERECRHCDHTLLAPADEKHDVACPGCRLYHRYRCFRCGSTFDAQPMGRPRTVCHHCNDSKSSGTTGSTSSHP